jgi:hypothetical protein
MAHPFLLANAFGLTRAERAERLVNCLPQLRFKPGWRGTDAHSLEEACEFVKAASQEFSPERVVATSYHIIFGTTIRGEIDHTSSGRQRRLSRLSHDRFNWVGSFTESR